MKKFIIYILICCGLMSCDNSEKFTVMTYNIRYDNPNDGINSWIEASRKEKVFSMLTKHHPDILGVQEALYHQVTDTEDFLRDDTYTRIGVGRDDGKQGGEYVPIFFNNKIFTLLNSGYFWLSETPEKPSLGWDATCCNRITTWVYLKGREVDFYVFNTHFDHEGIQAQQESSKLILSKIEEITQGKPVILMGDFNMTPNNKAIQILKEGNLRSGYSIFKSKKNLPKGTFNAFKTEEELRGKIDYIFVSPQIEFLDYTIDDSKINKLYPSDHLPIWARIKINNNN